MIRTLKQIAFDFRLKVGYSTAFVLLLLSYILTLYGNKQIIKQTIWVNHTNRTIINLEKMISGIKDAETGVRGYINTSDSNFLAPYKNSRAVVDSAFSILQFETKDNVDQQNNLRTLKDLINDRYQRLEYAIATFPKAGYKVTDSIMASFYIGKAKMDSIRATVNSMQQLEKKLLDDRTKDLDDKHNTLNIIILTSFIVALLFAVISFYTYRREASARRNADKRVADYQNELQRRIVDLDKANKELVLMKRSEKFAATGRIARTIAHEVRNPLTNIDLAVSQIKSDIPVQDDSVTMLFNMIERNSKRINLLISELLNATRFAELNYATTSINTLLDEALELAKDRIELNQVSVEKNYDNGICDIAVDAQKIKIAFLNLIVNAIEAVEPGKGILQIITRLEENKCVVEIKDNGYGMSEEQLNNLFEPYFTTKTNGNGLGLTNTQNIILNHRGSISVTSTPLQGTSFIIKFDLNPAS